MCGIVGYVGKKNCIPILINGLKNLEYRGYDSAGIAFLNDNQIKIIKKQGRLINLEKEIDNKYHSNLGIGHTRWATHGVANEINAHPHNVGEITLIHNGIIENYEELRNELINHGYQIDTENDTKIACAYIDYLYKFYPVTKISSDIYIVIFWTGIWQYNESILVFSGNGKDEI